MTTTLTQPSARVRLRPAPAHDPPLDSQDEPSPWTMATQQPTLLPASASTPRERLRATAPAPTGASPDCRTASARFVNTCMEIFNGYRPVGHMRALASPVETPTVLSAMSAAARRLARQPHRQAGPGNQTLPLRLRRMRVCEPRPGVAEISAVIGAGSTAYGDDRSWAAAFRLEQHQGRWRCTVAHLL